MSTSTAPQPGVIGASSDYDFQDARRQWSSPPFDNIGYLSSEHMLGVPAAELRDIVARCEQNRYALESSDGIVRNHNNRWREALGLDATRGKRILDFGCGMGIEALQFARAGNRVVVADIAPTNARLAARVLEVFGLRHDGIVDVSGEPPFFELPAPVDIFYSNGVLHHTPRIREILAQAHRLIEPGGEARLMLYSDKGWLAKAQAPLPPEDADIAQQPGFERFVRAFDSVGRFADWYNPGKISAVAGPGFKLVHFEYLTKPQWYCAAILKKV